MNKNRNGQSQKPIYDCFGSVMLSVSGKFDIITTPNITIKGNARDWLLNTLRTSRIEYVENERIIEEQRKALVSKMEGMSYIMVAKWLRSNNTTLVENFGDKVEKEPKISIGISEEVYNAYN